MLIDLTVWTLAEGLELVRRLQPESRQFGYHLALGGGVINNGSSIKDLDLYVLPLDDQLTVPSPPVIVADWLIPHFGEWTYLMDPKYTAVSRYRAKLKFENGGKRIDVFIV